MPNDMLIRKNILLDVEDGRRVNQIDLDEPISFNISPSKYGQSNQR